MAKNAEMFTAISDALTAINDHQSVTSERVDALEVQLAEMFNASPTPEPTPITAAPKRRRGRRGATAEPVVVKPEPTSKAKPAKRRPAFSAKALGKTRCAACLGEGFVPLKRLATDGFHAYNPCYTCGTWGVTSGAANKNYATIVQHPVPLERFRLQRIERPDLTPKRANFERFPRVA